MPVMTEPLKFKVAPHIVEDLGLNLYTTLARVLVEFVANAYDADSPSVNLDFNVTDIKQAREVLRKEYELEQAKMPPGKTIPPLETRVLPDDVRIIIDDNGHGMSRSDLNNKFLFAGRRRRREEPEMNGRSPKGRPLMGRKGLGKLAGFGVAKVVEVISRKEGERHATHITLDYDDIVAMLNVHEINIKEQKLKDGGGIAPCGTRIILSRLLYDPLKSRETTIQSEISEYFDLIDPADFKIMMNKVQVKPAPRELVYAWPDPELRPIGDFVEKFLDREGGGQIRFTYRVRFTGKDQSLEASKRGVRVYARKRLASAPSLLGMDTNMHGFRMTDYMDGVVHADFIDDELADYISTDRESLRWESPLLSQMYDFLSSVMKEACKQYQKKRDNEAPKIVENDPFTNSELEKYDFSSRDRKLALRFATLLEKACKRSVDDPAYQDTLPQLIKGIGHGMILTAISQLSNLDLPDLGKLVSELVRLAKDELDQFVGTVKARLRGIDALKKIIEHPDFKAKRNEKQIQQLFENCTWLVDPTYTQFLLAADVSLNTVYKRLAQDLKIGSYADPEDKKEPDLVFLLGNESLHKIVIVELKASNVPLEADHLVQLEYYMTRTQEWLDEHNRAAYTVFGHLIGTKPTPNSRAYGAVGLRGRISNAGPDTRWKVRDFLDVLNDTQSAHQDMLNVQEALDKAP
ncbi:ATP-binding protein [Paludisphaera mucosa]|uniref:ATP-binding protein n=1 Tax=Paludisphaera mucosa TaxID=3030827 RepID=A0ABT6FGD2_9BACT|nr:ATP-binding protein [Paludisphaera mucosa]MDG3006622.1 ATP-binding protein [Paludisphaera mucosa]